MDLRVISLCTGALVLAITSGVYGWKFLVKRNYLLGIEWWVVTFSASNLLAYLLTGSHIAYGISFFCDAFSRGFGIPVIAVAGLMAVTHRYKPSIRTDVLFFAGSILGTGILVGASSVAKVLPYFYVATWIAFSMYLAYFARRLLSVGESLHALGVILALLSALGIACIYDFYKIPGEETNVVMNFLVLATLTWSWLLVEVYYAYGALERSEAARQTARPGHAFPTLEREVSQTPLA
jgi:hypothetical protein